MPADTHSHQLAVTQTAGGERPQLHQQCGQHGLCKLVRHQHSTQHKVIAPYKPLLVAASQGTSRYAYQL
jgi:hypothetical protein